MTPNTLSGTKFYQAQLGIQASGGDLPILLTALTRTHTNVWGFFLITKIVLIKKYF